ncbi:MAG: HD domain-containing protein [Patescibacteria group bacterium]
MDVLKNMLVRRAAAFAKEKHRHQKRRNGEPYFTHPEGVAEIVLVYTKDPEVVAAAYLHDLIEDTECDFENIEERFGKRVARYVALLSRDFRKPKVESLNEFRRDMKKAPPEVKLIAAADAFHNARTPADAVFMKRWFKKALITLQAVEVGKLGRYGEGIRSLISEVRQEAKRGFPR